MKIRNNNPLDLDGANHEAITVAVTASGTANVVAYNLDGAVWHGGTFNLNQAAHDPSILVMFFTFSGGSGGVYTIVVTGSGGGDTSTYQVIQLPGQASNAVAYTFDVI
jgi:hypothetical protein